MLGINHSMPSDVKHSHGCESSSSSVKTKDLNQVISQPNRITIDTAPSDPSRSAIAEVGNFLKSYLKDFDPTAFKGMMLSHLNTLNLLDQNGEIVIPSLKAKQDSIIPPDLKKEDCEKFIDEIVSANKSNEYLEAFLSQATKGHFSKLEGKIKNEGSKVIPETIAYAIVLEGITSAMKDDYKIIEDLSRYWVNKRKPIRLTKHFNWFEIAKIFSVEIPMRQITKFHRKGKIHKNFLRYLLPLNIMEAFMSDRFKGFRGNAKAGWTLAVNNPKRKLNGDGTDGVSYWSQDKKSINFNLPKSKKWDDLYQTWNMSFISDYNILPLMMPKLLIPSVANYKNNPDEYIYNRALALYVHIYFVLFDRVNKSENGITEMDWADKELTKLWGEMNKESSLKYSQARS